ncbi:MAG: transcription termination/antitermination factor NusG [Planctomycetes bacterium]|nr:transcription termination/antitermination factor NusG [Planctomycetota bacterium]
MPRWYVLRVQAGREDFVKRNLDKMARSEGLTERILRVLIPSELVSEMKGRKKTVKERKLYPGYIMVQMLPDEETIYHVRGTQGVGDFVGGGATNAPDPLPEHEVERILGAAEKGTEEPKLNIQFKKGQSVKIKNGPFENFTGVVEEVSPTKGTIRVIVTIFGRATPIEVEYWEVEAI